MHPVDSPSQRTLIVGSVVPLPDIVSVPFIVPRVFAKVVFGEFGAVSHTSSQPFSSPITWHSLNSTASVLASTGTPIPPPAVRVEPQMREFWHSMVVVRLSHVLVSVITPLSALNLVSFA